MLAAQGSEISSLLSVQCRIWYTVHRNSPSYFENCVLHLLGERPRYTEDKQTDFKIEKRSARKQ
ncbi:hypothetical protein E4U44_000737 [Claviceps purpurea]|nr:hypothetical protein E4U44_000737 [Claviceps purpurea]